MTTHGASSHTTTLMLIQFGIAQTHMTTHSHSDQKSTMTPLAISLEQVAFMGRRKNLVEPTQKKQTQMLNITPSISLTFRHVALSNKLEPHVVSTQLPFQPTSFLSQDRKVKAKEKARSHPTQRGKGKSYSKKTR